MKKVLLVTRPIVPPWDEASKNFAYFLAQHIKGFAVTLLTNGRLVGLPEPVGQLPVYSKPRLSASQKLRLLRARRYRNDFDIIHYMLTPNSLNSLAFKAFLRGRRARTVQTIATLRDDKYSPQKLNRILFADKLVTYSDFAKQKLQKLGFKNVVRIYPGIDLKQFSPNSKAKNSPLGRKLGVTDDDFVVGYPGEYTRLGVTDDLVELLPRLAAEIPNLKFIFACRLKNSADAQKKAQVAAKVKSQGLADKVVFVDLIEDMAGFYNLCDVVLFPVRSMAGKFDVPLSIIEAMACGRPVVVSDLPVLAEFTSGRNALIVKAGDRSALAKQISRLYNDPKLGQQIGAAARLYTEKNFDIAKVTAAYEAVYNSLLP